MLAAAFDCGSEHAHILLSWKNESAVKEGAPALGLGSHVMDRIAKGERKAGNVALVYFPSCMCIKLQCQVK